MSGEFIRSEEEIEEANIRHYMDLLSEGDQIQKWKAAEALGRKGEVRAVDLLIEALRDEDWRVREKAAWALGKIGDRRAVPPLQALLRDEVEIVQEIAKEAIRTILTGSPPPLW